GDAARFEHRHRSGTPRTAQGLTGLAPGPFWPEQTPDATSRTLDQKWRASLWPNVSARRSYGLRVPCTDARAPPAVRDRRDSTAGSSALRRGSTDGNRGPLAQLTWSTGRTAKTAS